MGKMVSSSIVLAVALFSLHGVDGFRAPAIPWRTFQKSQALVPILHSKVVGQKQHVSPNLPSLSFQQKYPTSLILKESSVNSSTSDDKVPVAFGFFIGLLGSIVHFLVIRPFFPCYKNVSRYLLSVFMLSSAAMRLDNYLMDELLFKMVPPPLPAKFCVYASGIVEAVCGVLLLLPSQIEIGAKLTVALLLAVYPSNIYHAVSEKAQRDIVKVKASKSAHMFRLAIQLLLLAWANDFVTKW